MPAAPDFETIYQQEAALETALLTLFTAASITAHKARVTTKKVTPYVDIQATLGSETGRMMRDNAAAPIDRAASWSFDVAFRAITNRQDDTTTHDTYRAKIRNLLAQFTTLINAELTYHAVPNLDHNGTEIAIDGEKQTDISIMTFTGVIDVRAGSWPA
tara:strand:+ start:386 stop:862 length:477 start_codon:yes stop_codon:yes gene_type:complete